MIFEIGNDCLSVTIEDTGAQILSVKDRAGTEYMWQRNPDIWPRTAPVLFPVIGRLRDNAYTVNEKTYTMARHGFARNLLFTATERTQSTLVLSVFSDEKTKECYPYDFSLEISYQLDGARLIKTHTVINRSRNEMFFELGGHDGFRVALETGERMADYYIRFEGETELHPRLKTGSPLFSDGRGTLPLDEGKLWLDMALFREGALVLDRLQARKVLLCNAKGSRRLTFAFPNFPILGIWTPYKPFETNFVCLEAWSSLPDSVTAGPALSSKERVCKLEAYGRRCFRYTTGFPL